MAMTILMPALGQTMEEGTIVQWFKSEGDHVKTGELLLEVMTDKTNLEVEATETGVLRKIIAQVDDVIPVGDPICIIGTADESIEPEVTSPAPEQAAPQVKSDDHVENIVIDQPDVGRLFASPAARRVAKEHGLDITKLSSRGTGPNGRIIQRDVEDFLKSAPKVTPLASKMAAEMGIDIHAVPGSGIGGKVTSADIHQAASPVLTPSGSISLGARIPYTGRRKAVGDNVMKSAQSIPHVTLVIEVDMTECVALRNRILQDTEVHGGVRISYTDIIIKAVGRAIQDKPIVNSSLTDTEIIIHEQINVGVATAVEGALVVPVIKNVTSTSLPDISTQLKAIVARARAGKSTPDDFNGGTFTISNLGAYGIDQFDPIITPGQSAILGVCRIAEKQVICGGEIKQRAMMNLCLSFDHRIMDGVPAAEFLARLKEILENPCLLLT
ncbi:MAG: dihydrolipoamide acetyltransferase family protein [Armatimonadota bacterium]